MSYGFGQPHRRDDGHTCPVPGCNVALNASHPMCTPHWRLVPELLRKAMFPRKPNDAGYREAERQALAAVKIELDKKGGKG